MAKKSRRGTAVEWQSTGLQVMRCAYKNGVRIGVSEDQVQKVEKYLESEWGIIFPMDDSLENMKLTSLISRSVWESFIDVYNKRFRFIESNLEVPDNLELEFYDLIGNENLIGVVHSLKRSVILDQICASYSIAKLLPSGSKILEVGSHAAYLGVYLASNTECSITSEDFSTRAINLAALKGAPFARFKARERNYCTWNGPGENFDLVIACCAGNRNSTPRLIEYCVRQVSHGGLLFFVGDDRMTDRGRLQITESLVSAGFSLIEADVVGGLESSGPGGGYDGRLLLVFMQDGGGRIPKTFSEIAGRHWRGFSEYANNPSTPASRKTQAWYNAVALQG
jgi:hypothetical protein